jgi:hypothetical protein
VVVVVPVPLVATEATDMTLVEFLRARITEDEKRAGLGSWEGWDRRVLAECAAKRRIIAVAVGDWDEATIDRAVRLNQRGSTVVYEDGEEEEEVAEWTTTRLLRALAAVYADHADYQPEWKVDA